MKHKIVYRTAPCTVTDKDLSFTLYMEVEEGGDYATEEHPFVVWQIDVDEDGKPWNATPCRSLPTLDAAIEAAEAWT